MGLPRDPHQPTADSRHRGGEKGCSDPQVAKLITAPILIIFSALSGILCF